MPKHDSCNSYLAGTINSQKDLAYMDRNQIVIRRIYGDIVEEITIMIFKKSLMCNDAEEEEVAVTERFENTSYKLQATYMV
jgi:hypothetical protein